MFDRPGFHWERPADLVTQQGFEILRADIMRSGAFAQQRREQRRPTGRFWSCGAPLRKRAGQAEGEHGHRQSDAVCG